MILFSNMRVIVMFVTAVCVLFLIKLRWLMRKSFYDIIYLSLRKPFFIDYYYHYM